jgi:XTP/dITP diphosphohydrolase/tetrapyrrole methylase family protein/MazG family protein/ATP diphosphatase
VRQRAQVLDFGDRRDRRERRHVRDRLSKRVAGAAPGAIARLDELTRRLRRECPWDREQDERSIVSHTVSEAYELADAAYSGDDAKLLDELGDVLFQVHFLALLLEERGSGDLAAVADHCAQKLIRRHPHVFGEVEVDGSAQVRRNWDEIKRTSEGRGAGGLFADVPENLPGLSLAAKVQRRAESGQEPEGPPFAQAERSLATLSALRSRDERFEELGELLFAVVACARALDVDPELAVRAATGRFRERREHEAAPR